MHKDSRYRKNGIPDRKQQKAERRAMCAAVTAFLCCMLLLGGCGKKEEPVQQSTEVPAVHGMIGDITVASGDAEGAKPGDELRLLASGWLEDGSADIMWTVQGNRSKSTEIAEDGTLKIGSDETAKELMILAQLKDDANTFTELRVTVLQEETEKPTEKETEKETEKPKETEPETEKPTEAPTQAPVYTPPVYQEPVYTPPVYQEPQTPAPTQPSPSVPGNDGVTVIG